MLDLKSVQVSPILDIGNTRTKLTYQNKTIALDNKTLIEEDLTSAIKELNPTGEKIIIISVNKKTQKVIEETLQDNKIDYEILKNEQIPIKTLVDNINEIGTDRLFQCYLAIEKYKNLKKPIIVVSLGTATTIDYIDKNMVHHGGAIMTGLNSFNEALFRDTELKHQPFKKTNEVISSNSAGAIKAGNYNGYKLMLDSYISKIKYEYRCQNATVEIVGGGVRLL